MRGPIPGYRRVIGKPLMVCTVCGETVSTNALARTSHERGPRHRKAVVSMVTKAIATDCCCAGPDYHPDKPCPVHPKVRRP